MTLKSNAPTGPIETAWDRHRFDMKLVNPANKRGFNVIVVGTGLAGASAAATMAELGYNVQNFCYQDSPRRAHSIAAQGGINAAKNYQGDGDSVFRLFYDTVKGGDFRSRESNVYRLAQLSRNIIDQATAQGVPFAREYGGTLANRSFGGAQVSRTFYARGQTGQQLLLGAYQALMRQVEEGKVTMFPRSEMLELIVVDNRARGIVVRNLITGDITTHLADVVVLATGGYGNTFYLSTNAMGSNASAIWRAHRKGAFLANPCYIQIHPTCIPVHGEQQSKLTLMSESLRNDGRIWVPRDKADLQSAISDPNGLSEDKRDYYLERKYPAFGNLVPRDIASRNAKDACDEGRGVGPNGLGVYLDFRDAIKRVGEDKVRDRYGNLFEMYEQITAVNPYKSPMTIFPAIHYTMGGLWVDYNLESNLPGLFVLGEANFSDHGSNRLGASALMQGLADGYFVAPYTVGNFLARMGKSEITESHPGVKAEVAAVDTRINRLLNIKGKRSPTSIHKELGKICWDKVGIARDEKGLTEAIGEIQSLRQEFWENVSVPGSGAEFNQTLVAANRVADFLETAETIARDALQRKESCGGHLRLESMTPEGEALRNDEDFSYVGAWEYTGENQEPKMHKEDLSFEYVKLAQRSYK